MIGTLRTLICRDLRLTLGRGSEGLVTVFFFVLVATLFAVGLGGDAALIGAAAIGVIWVAAVLAALLTLEAVYHRDFDDGTLDLLLMSLSPLRIVVGKMLSHWVLSGGLLLPISVIVAQMLFVPWPVMPVLLASLLVGTLYLSLLGGLGAALTLGSRRPGLLLTVLVLPLFIPMLLLAVLAGTAALAGLDAQPYLLLQCALLLLALPLAPVAASASLQMNMRSS